MRMFILAKNSNIWYFSAPTMVSRTSIALWENFWMIRPTSAVSCTHYLCCCCIISFTAAFLYVLSYNISARMVVRKMRENVFVHGTLSCVCPCSYIAEFFEQCTRQLCISIKSNLKLCECFKKSNCFECGCVVIIFFILICEHL